MQGDLTLVAKLLGGLTGTYSIDVKSWSFATAID